MDQVLCAPEGRIHVAAIAVSEVAVPGIYIWAAQSVGKVRS